jgi:hypothetical protein
MARADTAVKPERRSCPWRRCPAVQAVRPLRVAEFSIRIRTLDVLFFRCRRTATPTVHRAHPYHESHTHRCAELHSRSSPGTVEGQVMCSTWTGGFVRLSASSATVIPATTTPKLRRLVAGRLRVWLRPGWRRHGPELCPGPRGAALLWACPQQARSSSALTPWEGRSADCALDLDRANAAPGSYVQVRAFVPAPLAAGRSRLNPAQARRSSSGAAHARRTGDCRGAGQVCYPSASAADAAACWMPTLGGRVAWPR